MKSIAICLFLGASLAIANQSSAQLRLGVAGSAGLSSAARINTPGVSNALRATTTTAKTTTQSTVNTTKQVSAQTANTAEQTKDHTRVNASVTTASSNQVSDNRAGDHTAATTMQSSVKETSDVKVQPRQ
jgi:hypothetical protein